MIAGHGGAVTLSSDGGHGTESVSSLEYINSMMLESQERFLRLFPSWPGTDAKFTRLRTYGAFLVSGKLNDGNIEDVEIYSEKGNTCSVLNPWPGQNIVVTDAENKEIKYRLDGKKVIFETKLDNTYFLTHKSDKTGVLPAIKSNNDIQIGDQLWMKGNLNVDTFNNGDPISEVKTPEEWEKAGIEKKPAWCYYGNSKNNGDRYGKLYNYWAVVDPRGLSPAGYHIPDDTEWIKLASFLGGRDHAGLTLKDDSFQATIGGYRSGDGSFYGQEINGYLWSSSVIFRDVVSNVSLAKSNSVFFLNYSRMQEGLTVRCIRD